MKNLNYETLYSEIASNVAELIPSEWEKVLLYFEVELGSILTWGYFYESNRNKPIELSNIEAMYTVNEYSFAMQRLKINKLVKNLNEEFFKSTGNRWANMTFIFNNVGKFEVKYEYENISDCDLMERRKKWKEKYLNSENI